MTIKHALGAASLATALAFGAAACNQTHAQSDGGQTLTLGGSKYCTPFKTGAPAAPGMAASDPQAAFEDCAHRWGYALAAGRDQAEVVAQAVVGACSVQLQQWNTATLSQNPQDGSQQATSLTTGQPTDMMGEHAQYAQGRALFYVVQARAGNCAAPPPQQLAENGAPPPAQPAPAAPTQPGP